MVSHGTGEYVRMFGNVAVALFQSENGGKMKPLLIAGLLALAANAAIADDSELTIDQIRQWMEQVDVHTERFKLFNQCKKMQLYVGIYADGDDATEIGLTQGSLWTLGASRLQAARLFAGSVEPPSVGRSDSSLSLGVTVFGSAFSYTLEYSRWMTDTENDTEGSATTWETGTTGTHGGDDAFIRHVISEGLDKFIFKYLRVNEEACSK